MMMEAAHQKHLQTLIKKHVQKERFNQLEQQRPVPVLPKQTLHTEKERMISVEEEDAGTRSTRRRLSFADDHLRW